jgi:hypothetical protein
VGCKALRTLDAALGLHRRGLLDDAASRFYFALFQATIFALERRGERASDHRPGSSGWTHWMVVRSIARVRGFPRDELLCAQLRRLRLRADYGMEPVRWTEIEDLRREVERFVREFGE